MQWARLITGRLISTIPVVLGVVTVVFVVIRLAPGDPAEMMVGFYGDSAKVAQVREEMGLDKPIWEQYGIFLAHAVQGNLGYSLRSNQKVTTRLDQAFVPTFELAVASMFLAIMLGVPAGIASALKPGSWIDHISMAIAVIGIAVPVFWLGMLLILVFGFYLGWFPPSGYGGIRYLILPALALSGNAMAFTARLVRTELLDTLSQDYIRTARAKGLKAWLLVGKHALRNSMLPTITALGIRFGELLGGAILVETVFAWPGLGSLLYDSVNSRDYTVIQGAALFIALGFVLVNLIVDLLYLVLNPRLQQ